MNQRLGALVAREQRGVNARAAQASRAGGVVQNGVQLCMAHIHVFGLQRLALAAPGHLIVQAANGHAVVAKRKNFVFPAHNARAHLGGIVFRALCRQQRNAHEVFVPRDIILPFLPFQLLKLFCGAKARNQAIAHCLCHLQRRAQHVPRGIQAGDIGAHGIVHLHAAVFHADARHQGIGRGGWAQNEQAVHRQRLALYLHRCHSRAAVHGRHRAGQKLNARRQRLRPLGGNIGYLAANGMQKFRFFRRLGRKPPHGHMFLTVQHAVAGGTVRNAAPQKFRLAGHLGRL